MQAWGKLISLLQSLLFFQPKSIGNLMFTSLGAKAGPTGKIVYKACWILLTSSETDSQTTFKDFAKFHGWVTALLPGDCGEPAPKVPKFHGNGVLTLDPGNFLPSTITRTIAKEKPKRGMQLQAIAVSSITRPGQETFSHQKMLT